MEQRMSADLAPDSAPASHGLLTAVMGYVALSVAWLSGNLLSDPDSYWHIAAGRWILANRAVPTVDAFSYTLHGAPWTAHEWLSEVILALVYQRAGWIGVQLLTAVAFALTMVLQARALLRHGHWTIAVTLVALTVSVTAPHLLARPHVLVWPLTVLWTTVLSEAALEARRPRWWTLVLPLLWVNMHGSFLLVPVIGGVFALDAVSRTDTPGERRAVFVQWAQFLTVAMACLLVNPRGWGAIVHAVGLLRMTDTLLTVREWQPLNVSRDLSLLLLISVTSLLGFTGRLRLGLVRSAALLAGAYLAVRHIRHQAVLGLISPILIAAGIVVPRGLQSRDGRPRGWRRLGAVGLGAVLLVGIGAARRDQPAPSRAISPVHALDVVRRAGTSGPVFNAYNFGGFLIFHDIPVFIDGRIDMYGAAFVDRLNEASRDPSARSLRALLDEYRVTWTLLEPGTALAERMAGMVGWRALYADSTAVVHIRSTGMTRSVDATGEDGASR